MKNLVQRRQRLARIPQFTGSLFACAAMLVSGCSGGGGGGILGSDQFILEEVSISQGQTWQINRPIRFRFSRPIDFGTVSMNTVSVVQLGGGPAVGDFLLDPAQPNVIVFQPACPTMGDFSDAGLIPGGVQYRIDVPTASSGATTVKSTGGSPLALGTTLTFSTPLSTVPSQLFLDTRPGPPAPLPGFVDANGIVRGTRIVLEGPGAAHGSIPFVLVDGVGRLPAEGALPPGGGAFDEFVVPLNLYSDIDSRFHVVLEVDQAVSPTQENISQARLQFQFLNAGVWTTFATSVRLVENCTETGASVILKPLGVLPQDRPMRVVMSSEFEDIVGDRNVLPLTDFATMRTSAFTDASGNPVEHADEFLEPFLVGGNQLDSFEDTEVVFDTPRATWGGGRLAANFNFDGTGGPGGNFDWHVPPNTEFVLDTTSTLILGGPNGVPTTSQLVINGVVNIRDLFVPASSSIRIQGPNPAVFFCLGKVTIDGAIRINGSAARSVFTLFTPFQPEPGAAGNGGGGDGGVGSFLTTTTTTRGGNGHGAFNVPFAGGQGGESGWHPTNVSFGLNRKAAGGGGGTFGHDVVLSNGCLDQSIIGLDAESGFPGATTANAAERPGEVMPWGGLEAGRPFNDVHGTDDDFWGVKRKDFASLDATLVLGELIQPWAGSGGGAGGDSTITPSYPPPDFIHGNHDKGAGGGGGAGALTMLVLGDIVFGPNGKVQAIGGHGNGGGNGNFVNRIGGGSGGGGGGHIILQTASRIDMSRVPVGTVAINAKGGQGGEGHVAGNAGTGGANDTGESSPTVDAHHVGVTDPGSLLDNPWIPPVPMECQFGQGVVRAAGGDGGPGVVQLHVGNLPGDILYPGGPPGVGGPELNLSAGVKPHPHGYDLDEQKWVDHLLPIFGRFSRAQSKWIPLGGAMFGPTSDVPHPIDFLFGGTDPMTGQILRVGQTVADLDPLLAPAAPIEAPGLPSIHSESPRTLLLDAAPLAGDDVIYKRNPNLLRRFRIRVTSPGETSDFDVQSATHDAAADVLSLTVASTGPALPAEGQVELIPRFFLVVTNGIEDHLTSNATVQLEFQAAAANALGQPDLANLFPGEASPETGGWTSDIGTLNIEESATFRFFRFRVTMDIQADDGQLSANTPRPELDFLRIPFIF